MNRRLLTSAVAIHATACIVAFLAVGPGEAGANAREANEPTMTPLDSFSASTQSSDWSNDSMSEEEWAKSLPVLEMPELPAHDQDESTLSAKH